MDTIYSLYVEAANGQPDALVFLLAVHYYFHDVDDLVDKDKPFHAEALVALLVKANTIYSTPFWIANSAALSAVMVQVANTWLDSVSWQGHEVLWKQNVADVLRLCGNDMVRAVAHITGGFDLMRKVSLRLREFSWQNQHEEISVVKVA